MVISLIGLFSATYNNCKAFQVWISKLEQRMHMKFGKKQPAESESVIKIQPESAFWMLKISVFDDGGPRQQSLAPRWDTMVRFPS
jgi:hypothetical protein